MDTCFKMCPFFFEFFFIFCFFFRESEYMKSIVKFNK